MIIREKWNDGERMEVSLPVGRSFMREIKGYSAKGVERKRGRGVEWYEIR